MVGLVSRKIISLLSISLFMFSLSIGSSYALTIYETIEKIVNNSPELRIIFEKKNQTVADYKENRSVYLPKLYFIFNKEYGKADPINSSSESSWSDISKFQLLVEQRIFDLEQIAKIMKSAQVVQTQEYQNQKLLESLIQMSIVSYYDVIQAEYLVSIYKEYLRQVKDIQVLTLNMRKQGDATLGDVNIVQARLASANSNLILYQANLDKSRLRLAYLLNLIDKNQVVDTSVVLPELSNKDFYDIGDKIISLIPVNPEEVLNRVLRKNIDILVLRSNLCVAGYDVEVQKSRYMPTVNFMGELTSAETLSAGTYSRIGKLTIEARYMIYDGGSRSSGVKKFASALKEMEYQYDVLLRDTSDQAYTVLNQLRSFEQQRLSVLKEIESSEEVDRVYSIQFQFASRSLTERLDNLERLASSRSRLVQMDYSILMTRMQILLMMGVFVEFFGFQNYLEVNNLKLC